MALVFSVMHLHNISILLLLLFIPFFLYFKKKSGIDKSTEWSTLPACLSVMCVCVCVFLFLFFNRGDTEGTNSLKMLCPMFVYVLFYVNLCHD